MLNEILHHTSEPLRTIFLVVRSTILLQLFPVKVLAKIWLLQTLESFDSFSNFWKNVFIRPKPLTKAIPNSKLRWLLSIFQSLFWSLYIPSWCFCLEKFLLWKFSYNTHLLIIHQVWTQRKSRPYLILISMDFYDFFLRFLLSFIVDWEVLSNTRDSV